MATNSQRFYQWKFTIYGRLVSGKCVVDLLCAGRINFVENQFDVPKDICLLARKIEKDLATLKTLVKDWRPTDGGS